MISQGAVEILDRVADMLPHPMEEVIPEVMLGPPDASSSQGTRAEFG